MTFTSAATERRRSLTSGKPYKPWKYQKRAIRFLLENSAAALFLDPGLGKTSIVYAAFLYMLKNRFSNGMIVVAPIRPAQMTWPAEKEKWADFQGLDVVVLHGKHKDALVKERHDVYVINYEGLDWLVKSGALAALLKNKWVDTLCWDELTKMKNSGSKRFKLMRPWVPKFARRWGLTGSPASNGLLNLFGQCYVLDAGNALGQFVTHYRAQFFVPDGPYDWKLADGAEKLIYERLKPLALRMASDELLELPKRMPFRVLYTLPPAIRAHYDELEEEFFTLIDANAITAVNSGVVSGKLRQLCSGAMYVSEYCELTGAPMKKSGKSREYMDLHTAKLDAFEELIDELNGKQVFVGYEFQHDLARLQHRFGDIPYIGGGTSDKDAKRYEAAWNAGDLPWLFANPASVAHGLNLQGSSAFNVVWFTVPWDFENYDQFIQRLLRQGNESKFMNIYHLIGEKTIEEWVMMTLINKDRTQKGLFEGLRNRRALKVDYDPAANMAAVRMMELANAKKRAAFKT
jgi:SNF2 family DNA or RNA helicase